MKGAAATVAGASGIVPASITMEPAVLAATGTRLLSITLPAAYAGQGFTITNNGDMPITISGSPSETILAPGETATLPDSALKFSNT